MKQSFEVSYFDPSGKIRFSAVREGWAEENGTWRNPELGLAFTFRLDPERRSYVRGGGKAEAGYRGHQTYDRRHRRACFNAESFPG